MGKDGGGWPLVTHLPVTTLLIQQDLGGHLSPSHLPPEGEDFP